MICNLQNHYYLSEELMETLNKKAMRYSYFSPDGNAQKPVENEHTVLECPIFDEDGNEIAMGSIDVKYYQVGSKTFIVNTSSACHPDDVQATLWNEFKNYERV